MRYTELSKEAFSPSIKIYFFLLFKVLTLHLSVTSNNDLTGMEWVRFNHLWWKILTGWREDVFWVSDPFNTTGISAEGTPVLKQAHRDVLYI